MSHQPHPTTDPPPDPVTSDPNTYTFSISSTLPLDQAPPAFFSIFIYGGPTELRPFPVNVAQSRRKKLRKKKEKAAKRFREEVDRQYRRAYY